MVKKFAILVISIMVCFLFAFSACSSDDADNNTPEKANDKVLSMNMGTEVAELNGDKQETDIFAQITDAEYIELSDAYNQLNNIDGLTKDAESLYQKLGLLKNCSGRFVQQSDDSSNRYTADVAFYLVKGEIFCSIDYSGYIGEISDGRVFEAKQNGYYFEAFPKGDLYGREQDFKIYFENEKLYISWDDTCEYTLTRGDGSADSVEEHRENLKESGLLDTIISVVDRDYINFEHRVVYDESTSSLYIYIEGLDNLRTYLTTNNSNLIETWQGIAENAATLSDTVHDALNYYVDYVYVFWVDMLKSSDSYAQSEILLKAENGVVKYNLVEDRSIAHSPDDNSGNPDSSNNDKHIITAGERNAIETARNYLSFMAFSYGGLVEQLKHEGYSTSEAEYAAENCGADWNQQAVNKAKEYLNFMSFSRSGLIEQLEFEGFTHSQAVYAADKVY